jgi:hypothetical protein
MKTQNLWKIIAVLSMLVLLVAGCGKKDDDNNPIGPSHNPALVGTWVTVLYELFGEEIPPNTEPLPLIEVTLEEDGTLEYTRTLGEEDTTGTGTWSTSGSEATINLSDGMTISGTYTLNETGDELIVDATVSVDLTPDDGVNNPQTIPVTIHFDKVEAS